MVYGGAITRTAAAPKQQNGLRRRGPAPATLIRNLASASELPLTSVSYSILDLLSPCPRRPRYSNSHCLCAGIRARPSPVFAASQLLKPFRFL